MTVFKLSTVLRAEVMSPWNIELGIVCNKVCRCIRSVAAALSPLKAVNWPLSRTVPQL